MSPLTREQREAYGPDWPDVSAAIRERAGQQCECEGECGWTRHAEHTADMLLVDLELGTPTRGTRCAALNGRPSPYTGSTVVLTVAHLDHNPGSNDPDRLRAMCQGCHLAYDRKPS